MEKRIGAALSAVGAMKAKFCRTGNRVKVRICLYNTMIMPTLTYGAESWMLKDAEK